MIKAAIRIVVFRTALYECSYIVRAFLQITHCVRCCPSACSLPASRLKKIIQKVKIYRKAAYVACNLRSSVEFEGEKVRNQLSVRT